MTSHTHRRDAALKHDARTPTQSHPAALPAAHHRSRSCYCPRLPNNNERSVKRASGASRRGGCVRFCLGPARGWRLEESLGPSTDTRSLCNQPRRVNAASGARHQKDWLLVGTVTHQRGGTASSDSPPPVHTAPPPQHTHSSDRQLPPCTRPCTIQDVGEARAAVPLAFAHYSTSAPGRSQH